jgi:basic membrane protein A and related proteins
MEAEDLVGKNIGRYTVIGQLGEGGMAVVYKALDPRLDRHVAIKILKVYLTQSSGEFIKRFDREARVLARLQHPNIVPVIDYGSTENRFPYLVMPYLAGGTLRVQMGSRWLPDRAAETLMPVADALAYAHRLGIIHRDIKPSNIMLTESGNPMLTDFGIARLFEGTTTQLTASGAAVGTPGYMAPEQWAGSVVPQTDIYALGVVLYELLTGTNPFAAETPQTALYRQLMEPMPSPRRFVPEMPREVERVLFKALEREPAARFANMETFTLVLRRMAVGDLAGMEQAGQSRPFARPDGLDSVEQISLDGPLSMEGPNPGEVGYPPPYGDTTNPPEKDLTAALLTPVEEPAAVEQIPTVDLQSPQQEEKPLVDPQLLDREENPPAVKPADLAGRGTSTVHEPVSPLLTETLPVGESLKASEPHVHIRKRFPWLIVVGGLVIVAAIAAVLVLGEQRRERDRQIQAAIQETLQAQTTAVEAQAAIRPTATPAATATTAPTITPLSTPTRTSVLQSGISICMEPDTGGVNDLSFNASAWSGAQRASSELGVQVEYLQPASTEDYAPQIKTFVDKKCTLIVGVGFQLADQISQAATQYPGQNFVLLDATIDPAKPNVLSVTFQTDQTAFLAGYLAAGMTRTGKVGTFGGVNIPPVTLFMDGFAHGVQYYNQKHGTNVKLVGWDGPGQTGLFVGNFTSVEDGKTISLTLISEGVDVIFPVAGPVGIGALKAARQAGFTWVIGVDSDWTVSSPEYQDVILTSVLKRMDNVVYHAAKMAVSGTFSGGTVFTGTLENEGVGLGVIHKSVLPDLLAELESIRQDIISGKLKP